jgi:hypothetical protein
MAHGHSEVPYTPEFPPAIFSHTGDRAFSEPGVGKGRNGLPKGWPLGCYSGGGRKVPK